MTSSTYRGLGLVMTIVALSAVTASAAVHTYEMGVGPDAEANPMTKVESGYGSGGLQGGTAAFGDNGIGDAPGFFVTGLGSTYTIDMNVRADENPLGTRGFNARSMGIADASIPPDVLGLSIQIRKDGLWLVDRFSGNNNPSTPDVIDAKVAVDLTSLRRIRLSVSAGALSVYDLDSGAGVLLAGGIPLLDDGAAQDIEDGTGGVHLNSLQASECYAGKFTLDWLRIDDTSALTTEAPLAAPAPSGCGIAVGPKAAKLPALPNTVFGDDFNAYPSGPLDGQGPWDVDPDDVAGLSFAVVNRGAGDQAVDILSTQQGGNTGPGVAVAATGLITLQMDIKGDGGLSAGNMWTISLDDANGQNLARWYGGNANALERIGNTVGTNHDLTDAAWHTLRAEINTETRQTTYFFDDVEGSTLTFTAPTIGASDAFNMTISASKIPVVKISVDNVVITSPTNDATVLEGSSSPTPSSLAFTIENTGASAVNYTVTDEDSSSWINLVNTNGNLASGASTTVTANIVNTAALAEGIYTSELKFVDDCVPPNDFRAIVQLEVLPPCQWRIVPLSDGFTPWCKEEKTWAYTVYNDSEDPLSYTVAATAGETGCIFPTDGATPRNVPAGGSLVEVITTDMDPGCPNPGGDRDATITFTSSTGCAQTAVVHVVRDRTININGEPIPPGADWVEELMDLQYHGDLDPDASHSGGPNLTFQLLGGSSKIGSVVDDVDAVDGKAWLIDTTGGPGWEFWGADRAETGNAHHLGHTNGTNGQNAIGHLEGTTLIARVKVEAENGSGKTLGVTNKWEDVGSSPAANRNNSAALHLGTASVEEVEYYNEDHSAAVNLADGEYHIIRMAAGRGINRTAGGEQAVKVWVDENPTPVIEFSGRGRQPWNHSHPSWWFGMSQENTGSKIYFDYVTATNAGMFGPGQEEGCTSESQAGDRPEITHDLTPPDAPNGVCCTVAGAINTDYVDCITSNPNNVWLGYGSKTGDWPDFDDWDDVCVGLDICNDPFADADLDGDVDQEDFAVLQECHTGSNLGPIPTDPAYCKCFDKGADNPAGDDDIDSFDVDAFQDCASGPDVPANPACDG